MKPKLEAVGITLMMIALTQVAATHPAAAQSADELAKKLSNPVANLISVPFQYNYSSGFGDGDGEQSYINIQSVIPFSIGEGWNLISRTILPVVNQSNFSDDYGTRSGLGNITQSFFFSPKEPTKGGVIWGVGPVYQIPTSTDGIAPNQWGAGISGVALKQANGWTVGVLCKPRLVDQQERQVRRSVEYLPAALPQLHDKTGDFLCRQHRVGLQLGERGVVGPDQHDRVTDHQGRRQAGAANQRRALLG